MNIWYSFNGWGQIIGGLVAYGIAVGTKQHGSLIAPWKIVFLFTGLLTIVLGLIFLWLVPDSQLNARWLTKQDRILAIARVRVNQQGIGNKHFKLYQAKEALLDPMTWAFFLFAILANIPNGGITNFFSQLVCFLPCISTTVILDSDRDFRFRSKASAILLSRVYSTAHLRVRSRLLLSC